MDKNSDQPKAIPFIIYRKPEGFIITDQARTFFNQFAEKKIGLVSIVGKYRTGKSYLINKVILNNPSTRAYMRESTNEQPMGFPVGSTVNACTKGIWVWTKALKSENEEEDDTLVVVRDTEGFGAVTEGHNHDSRVILFSMLLSSMFVYNSVGNIDENALQTLGLVVNMAKNIQLESTGTEELDEDTIAETFPLFFWIVRDFSLKLVDENNFKISSGLYLEKALENIKGHSSKTEAKNKVRRLIKHFFKKRDCMTMIRPVENESDLQRLEELPDYRLRKDFVQQIHKTRKLIFQRVTAKRINGQFVDGPRLIALAEAYVESVNNGRAPCIENAWEFVRKFENKKLTEKTIGLIKDAAKVFSGDQLAVTLNLVDLFDGNPDLLRPRKAEKQILELSEKQLTRMEDYHQIKPFLVRIYKENLLGDVEDNLDLVEEFSEKLDLKIERIFKSLEGEVEKNIEADLEREIQLETQALLGAESLQLESCHKKYDQVWMGINQKYQGYFSEENGLKEKVRGIFEREKAKTYGLLLKEVQNRRELETERRNQNEKMRIFREGEARKRAQEELEEYKESLVQIKKKHAERVVAFREQEKNYKETQQRVTDLEITNTKLKEKIRNEKEQVNNLKTENEDLIESLKEKVMMLEEEQKQRSRDQAMSNQKEELMQQREGELKEEIENLRKEVGDGKKRQKDFEKQIKEMQDEQDREDRVVVDSEQLKVLQDKLQEYVERLEDTDKYRTRLQKELKERETENDLLKGRVEIMEKNFTEIEAQNKHFLNEITNRVENIKRVQPEKLSETLTLNLQKFSLWKKILKICNLFQCGKCSRFIPKKLILVHLEQCLSSNELQILGLIEASRHSLEEMGIEGIPQNSLIKCEFKRPPPERT